MITDSQLQAITGWKQEVGANIGGVSPTSYGFYLFGEMMVFYTEGTAYADWLAAISRPICPNSGKLSLAFEVIVDEDSLTSAQALEFDTKLSIASYIYNFSSQLNYAEGGTLQISNAAGSWIDTGFKPGKLTPLTWHTFVFNYSFNTSTKTYSFVSAEIDGVLYTIPANLQNLKAVESNWADSANFQVQLDLNSVGGSFSEALQNVEYVWN
jgi:hypothetical protein